jgi:hypothetical protein
MLPYLQIGFRSDLHKLVGVEFSIPRRQCARHMVTYLTSTRNMLLRAFGFQGVRFFKVIIIEAA